MKLIVGLGNPGREYEHTRHNVGFMFLDEVVSKYNGKFSLNKQWKCEISEIVISENKVMLIKPQTYMNLSGEAVVLVKNFYKISLDDIFVIHDDLDLEVGRIRIREHGSSGGHRGMQNIMTLLSTTNIKRLKIGISKVDKDKTINHVLGEFTYDESILINETILKAHEIIYNFLTLPFSQLMNRYN